MAVARLVAYLLGVASMGVIAQGAVGSSLHDVVWTTTEQTVPGDVRVVTETTTAGGTTVTHTNGPGKRPPAASTTSATVITVAGPTRTDTVTGEAVSTTVSSRCCGDRSPTAHRLR